MAQNSASENDSRRNSWYCHICGDKTNISLPDYACSKCNSGFVEQMEEAESSHAGPSASSMQRVFVRSSPYVTSRGPHRSIVGRTRVSIRRLPPPTPGQENSFHDFMNHLIERVTGDENETGAVNVGAVNVVFGPAATTMMMNQISGNLVIASAGIDRLDNIITMLLNQLDAAGTGPPPASKDEIDALPTINVLQEQVDSSMQCIVCMEDYKLEEPVRSLPCKHLFHSSCIVPWLELHGTCPVCRRGLGHQSTSASSSSSASSASPINLSSRSRRYQL